MKKKILSILITVLSLCTCMFTITACSPSTGEPTNNCEHVADGSGYCSLCNEIIGSTEGVLYELSDDESYAEVFGYEGSSKNVIIAEEYNGKPVKSIYKEAFKSSSIKSVVIPDSVTSIGDEAFSYCESLTSVTIGNSVTSIGDFAFSFCDSLTSVTIGNSVTSIGGLAFYGCEALTSITIPDRVTSIGDLAFSNCRSLISVTIGNSVTNIGYEAFSYCNSSLYTTENNLKYFKANNNPYCILVEAINKNLSSYQINSQTKYIANSVFYSCERLTQITIPDSVTSIGDDAFYGCTSLQYYIDGNLKYLGNTNNPYLYLAGVTSTSITNATINENCKIIGSDAFYYCRSLTSVTIGNGVTSIGEDAFYNCNSLTKVNYTGTIDDWAEIEFGGYASNPLYYAKNLYINDVLVTEVVLTTATKISDYAFYDCDSLTSVTIPDSVTSIGKRAFSYCNLLTSIKYCGSEDQWKNIAKGSDWNYNTGSYTIVYNYAG